MASAVPLAIGALGSYLGSRGASRQADTAFGAQQAAYGKQGDLAQQLSNVARDRYNLTNPAYGRAINYYNSLLGGNQAATLQAVSPDIRRLTDVSRGAQSAIDTRLTGAARQQATADLVRNRYADIAALTGAPRQQAAATLLGEGAAGSTGLTGALGTAGSMYGAQGAGYGQSYQNAMDRLRDVNKQWADFGTGLTKTLGPNWIQSLLGRGGDLPNVDLPKTGTSIWKTENWRPRFVK